MPNELSEKVYPDGTIAKLRDDAAREQIGDLSQTGLTGNSHDHWWCSNIWSGICK